MKYKFSQIAVIHLIILLSTVIFTPYTKGSTIFSDAVFNIADWQLVTEQQGNGGSLSFSQEPTGGDIDEYMRITLTVNAAPSNSAVGGIFMHKNAIYDPAQNGAIQTVDYSESSIMLSGWGDGQATGLAIRQNDRIYYAGYSTSNRGLGYANTLGWTQNSFTGLTSSDFGRPFGPPDEHPDFSETATPLQFGFYRLNSTPSFSYSIEAGIDNWSVTIHNETDLLQVITEVIINVNCDDHSSRHEISPDIYGLCHADTAMLEELNIPLNRYGGNRSSTYNWKQNACNTCEDDHFISEPYDSSEPGGFVDQFISDCLSTETQPMITVPTIGWVAKLGPNRSTLASYPKSVYPYPDQMDDFVPFDSGLAGTGMTPDEEPIYGNPQYAYVPSASSYQLWGMIMSPETVFQDEWIWHIVTKWGLSNEGGVRYYILDNEPALWHTTHRDIRSVGFKMDELFGIMIEYARMIKDIDPGALVVGPELFGWTAYFLSGYDQQVGESQVDEFGNTWAINWDDLTDRSNHNEEDLIPWLLSEFNTVENSSGRRLLDVLSIHHYAESPQFRHDGVPDDVSSPIQLLRNRSTRRLWDEDYVDESWINEPVRLIPRLREWVDNNYKGTKIAITEYSWGAVEHMNGATAQADILGIFGRYRVDMATHWKWPKLEPYQPVYHVFKLYRNYDGAGSETSVFGNMSLPVSIPDPGGATKDYRDHVSAYAAKRSVDNALTLIVINKELVKDFNVTVNLCNFADRATAQVWQLREPEPSNHPSIQKLDDIDILDGNLMTNLPKQSITLFVIKAEDEGELIQHTYANVVIDSWITAWLQDPLEWCLGAPDELSIALGDGGWIVLDMGLGEAIVDGDGADLIVYEDLFSFWSEGYAVYGSNEVKGPWILIGTGVGTQEFDLADQSGLVMSRYIKVWDDNDWPWTWPWEGFDLDAVEALNMEPFDSDKDE